MRGWFDSEERLAMLRFKAAKWIGTPFRPNSNTPGPEGGVSCQKLVAAIYQEAGFRTEAAPDTVMSHARFNRESILEAVMGERKEFERLVNFEALPGDLLGFRMGGTVHHAGILLGEWGAGAFVHALVGVGVTLSYLTDGTWGKRLAVVWRPRIIGSGEIP